MEISFETVDPIAFVMLTGICKFAVAGVGYLLLVLKKEEQQDAPHKTIGKSSVLIVCGSALLSGAAFVLQLLSASELPATVLFPILTGGTMILTSLAGVILFKDKLSKNTVIGLAICFVGTLLFL